MKILLINHFPLQGSGSGIYTMNIARELVKKGHEVQVIDLDNIFDKNSYGFTHTTILCNKFENPAADLDFNFPCFTTHPRSLQTFYDLDNEQLKKYVESMNKAVRKVCKKFKPDVIHAQHLWISPYVAYKNKIPYIATCHGTDLMGFRKDERYHSYALTGARNASKIIAISEQVHADILDTYKIPDEQIQLVPNGFDQDIFKVLEIDRAKILQQFGVESPAEKVVSFVGKFTDFKGIDLMIDAVKTITEVFPSVKFLLAGDGQLLPNLKKITEDENMTNVHFLGHLSQQAVSKLYNLADVSVVPSRVEPFGLVAIEALACGTPVIATNAGGLPDFINAEVGQLIEQENSVALAKAIIEELQQNTKLTKGTYAAKYASENFSWEHSINSVIDLYQQAIDK